VARLAAPEISSRWEHAPLHSYAAHSDKKLAARYRLFTELIAEPP
jgi:hypothetical protein